MIKLTNREGQCLISVLLLLICAGLSFAQGTADGTTLIRTTKGMLVVHNEQGLNFTLELNGKEVKQVEPKSPFLNIDGRIAQIHTVGEHDFAPDIQDKKLNDWLVLERYRDWEVDYISNLMTAKLKVSSEYLTLAQNQEALLWSYPTPAGVNQEVKSQLYLTIVSRGHVIALNCAVQNNDNDATAKKFMLETFATLKFSDKPIDVQVMQEAIRKGIM